MFERYNHLHIVTTDFRSCTSLFTNSNRWYMFHVWRLQSEPQHCMDLQTFLAGRAAWKGHYNDTSPRSQLELVPVPMFMRLCLCLWITQWSNQYILKMTWTHFSPAAVIRSHQPASAYRFVYVRGPQNIYNLLFNEVVVLQFTLKRFWFAFVVNKYRYVYLASFTFVNQTGQATGPWCVWLDIDYVHIDPRSRLSSGPSTTSSSGFVYGFGSCHKAGSTLNCLALVTTTYQYEFICIALWLCWLSSRSVTVFGVSRYQ